MELQVKYKYNIKLLLIILFSIIYNCLQAQKKTINFIVEYSTQNDDKFKIEKIYFKQGKPLGIKGTIQDNSIYQYIIFCSVVDSSKFKKNGDDWVLQLSPGEKVTVDLICYCILESFREPNKGMELTFPNLKFKKEYVKMVCGSQDEAFEEINKKSAVMKDITGSGESKNKDLNKAKKEALNNAIKNLFENSCNLINNFEVINIDSIIAGNDTLIKIKENLYSTSAIDYILKLKEKPTVTINDRITYKMTCDIINNSVETQSKSSKCCCNDQYDICISLSFNPEMFKESIVYFQSKYERDNNISLCQKKLHDNFSFQIASGDYYLWIVKENKIIAGFKDKLISYKENYNFINKLSK